MQTPEEKYMYNHQLKSEEKELKLLTPSCQFFKKHLKEISCVL